MACRDGWNTWPSGLRSPQNPPASPSGFAVPGVPRAMYFTHHGKPWLKPTISIIFLYFLFFILHGIAYWNMMYYSSTAPNKKCRLRKIRKTPGIAICCSIRPLQHHYCSQMEHKWSTGRERLSASVTMETFNRFTAKHYRAATNDWWVEFNKEMLKEKTVSIHMESLPPENICERIMIAIHHVTC